MAKHELENTKDAATLEIDSLEATRRIRFQEQCFLNYNRNLLYNKMIDQKVDVKYISGGNNKGLTVTKPLGKRGLLENDHVVSLLSKDPASLISNLNKVDGAQLFFRLDSPILSQLKPIVELYKLFPNATTFNEQGDAADKPPLKIKMQIGEGVKAGEEGFFGHAKAKYKRQETSAIEKQIFQPQNILGNAMFRDLNFTFAGRNVAEVNTIEKVSFTMSFSSTELFFHNFLIREKPAKSSADEPTLFWSYQDLVSYTNRAAHKFGVGNADVNLDEFNRIRLSCAHDSKEFVDGSDDLPDATGGAINKSHFEIQLVLRYDPDDINWEMVELAGNDKEIHRFSDNEKTAIKNFLRSSAVIMRLNLIQHTIRYSSDSGGADPELTIDFEFAAFTESSLNSYDLDLLANPSADKKLLKLLKNLADARRLLSAVETQNKTLQQIFGGGENSQRRSSFAQKYMELRESTVANSGFDDRGQGSTMKPMGWSLIQRGQGNSSIVLIPTQDDLKKAQDIQSKFEEEKTASQKRMIFGEDNRPGGSGSSYEELTLKNGLTPNNKDNPRAGAQRAQEVFRELVNNLKLTIDGMRRANIYKRYGYFFEALWKTNRMYKIDVEPQKLGIDKKSLGAKQGAPYKNVKTSDEGAMATHRKERTKEYAILTPGTVMVVDETGGAKGGAKHAKDFQERTSGIIKKGTHATNKQVNDTFEREAGGDIYREGGKTPQLKSHGDLTGFQTKNAGYFHVYFTTLGDIIDTVISLARMKKFSLYSRRIGILLGPVADSLDLPENEKLISLADVPISIKMLMGFWVEKVLTRARDSYFLGDFIKDVIADLILPALGSRCIDDAGTGNMQLGAASFIATMHNNIAPFYPSPLGRTGQNFYPTGGSSRVLLAGDKFIDEAVAREAGTANILPWFRGSGRTIGQITKVSPEEPIENQFNYMVIYINNFNPYKRDPSEEQKNIGDGVYYLHLGTLPSIVDQATFQRDTAPYIREARATSRLTSTGGIALRDVYRFTCSMHGNNIFKPGMLVFVDPTRDGATNFKKWVELGIGGFYRIISVSHSAIQGNEVNHKTSITCMWETFGRVGGECK